MRSEKGSITVYVLIAMLTFTAFLMAIYIRNSNKQIAQIQTTEKIKAIYEDYDIDEVYATLTGQVPEILGYERGAKEITIKTLVENGFNVDQNGKEIIYYAATTKEVAPTEISNVDGDFGVWQKSKYINIVEHEEEAIYVWIKNEDGNVSKKLDSPSQKDDATVQISAGEYSEISNKEYVDPDDNTKVAYIPAGFTVSNIEGETSLDEGLVIYSGNVTDWITDADADGILDAQEKYNQYVWIPVEDPNDMYGTTTEGEKYGKLYNFKITGEITNCNWPSEDGYDNTSYQEPLYLNGTDADDSEINLDVYGDPIVTEEGLKNEFDRMINSVKNYGGFYIGRYELTGSIDNPTIVKGVMPLNQINWYELYQQCEKVEQKNNDVNIKPSMIWGCQWDQAFIKAAEETEYKCLTNAIEYGIYATTSMQPSGTELFKTNKTIKSAYNIFDMNGNLADWTLEGWGTNRRSYKGGTYGNVPGTDITEFRSKTSPLKEDSSLYGTRVQLYL